MDFQSLVGQTFVEIEFYELLLAEVENHRTDYFKTFLHFYFECLPNGKITITELMSFVDDDALFKQMRLVTGKRSWTHICGGVNVTVMLCRINQTSIFSSVREDFARTEHSAFEFPSAKPKARMTREEIRAAFKELAGVLEDKTDVNKSKFKKSA